MMTTLVETAKCEGDELVLLLTYCLPTNIANLWHTTEDILDMLRVGGITKYTNKNRIGILLRNQKRINLEPNEFNKRHWYIFNEKRDYDDPRQQRDALMGKNRPQVEVNYFINLNINYKFIETTGKTTNSGAANQISTANSDVGKENVNASVTRTVSGAAAANDDNNKLHTKNTHVTTTNTKLHTSQQPTKTSNPSIINETGMCFSRINFTESVLDITNKHMKTCRNELHVIDRRKFGYEVMTDLGCNFCKKTFTVNSGPEAEEVREEETDTPKQRGRRQRPINMMMANAIHASAITIAQITGLCGEIGCVSPSERAQHDSARKRKDAILAEAEEVFAANRREHVKMCKVLCPDQTIKHKDGDGKEHHLCHGAVSADGAGDKRAYKHIITGKQHCTVVFSLITGRVLALKHDQLHCKRCAVRLTHVMAQQNKRFDEITEDDL